MKRARALLTILMLLLLSGCAERQLTFITPVSSMPQIVWTEESPNTTSSGKASDSKNSSSMSLDEKQKLAEIRQKYKLFKASYSVYESDYKEKLDSLKKQISDQKKGLSNLEQELQSNMALLLKYHDVYKDMVSKEYKLLEQKIEQEQLEVIKMKQTLTMLEEKKVRWEQEYTKAQLEYEARCLQYEKEITALSLDYTPKNGH